MGVGEVVIKLGSVMSASSELTVNSMTLFVALLCACIVIGHLLEENRWLNESITAIVIGLCTGVVILLTSQGTTSRILQFNEELFFIYLLPPIIFNAGFQVKKKQFFRNFLTIMLFGAVGTLISFGIISIGAECLFDKLDIGFLGTQDFLAIGAILSATDSVCTLQVLNQDETPFLYSLVFGEGVVNDATSVVLFNAIKKLDVSHVDSTVAFQFVGKFAVLFTASTLLGIVIGLVSAYIIKKLYFGRHSTDREVALMILMAYLSYVMAELFDLSGILTVFFCGIVMSHYTWHNVTDSSRVTTRHAFATLSFIAETFIFLYVGMDALDMEKWNMVLRRPWQSIGASTVLLGLVLVGRAAFVFPLSFLCNLGMKSHNKMEFKQQVTIWWAGLMRGAVSMALAYNQFTSSGHTRIPGHAIMITSTITVVLFSTMVLGLITKPLVRFLQPGSWSRTLNNNHSSSEVNSPKGNSVPLLSDWNSPEADDELPNHHHNIIRPTSLRMLLSAPTSTVHYYWRKFDDTCMRPVFGGRGFVPQVPGMPLDRSTGHIDIL